MLYFASLLYVFVSLSHGDIRRSMVHCITWPFTLVFVGTTVQYFLGVSYYKGGRFDEFISFFLIHSMKMK